MTVHICLAVLHFCIPELCSFIADSMMMWFDRSWELTLMYGNLRRCNCWPQPVSCCCHGQMTRNWRKDWSVLMMTGLCWSHHLIAVNSSWLLHRCYWCHPSRLLVNLTLGWIESSRLWSQTLVCSLRMPMMLNNCTRSSRYEIIVTHWPVFLSMWFSKVNWLVFHRLEDAKPQ